MNNYALVNLRYGQIMGTHPGWPNPGNYVKPLSVNAAPPAPDEIYQLQSPYLTGDMTGVARMKQPEGFFITQDQIPITQPLNIYTTPKTAPPLVFQSPLEYVGLPAS